VAVEERCPLRIEQSPAPPRHGFFMAAAVIDSAIRQCHQDRVDHSTLRAGVTNAFDAEQPTYFGTGFIDNMDPYGRRFNIGLNWRPF
jgi:outer membrane receptor protein involved in Fe transport